MSDEDNLEKNLKEINRFPILNEEQEEVLGRKILENGNNEAKNKLAKSNLRLTVEIAEEYENHGLKFGLLDLIQQGNLGLYKAIEKWDYRKEPNFGNYAKWWIRKAIHQKLGIEED